MEEADLERSEVSSSSDSDTSEYLALGLATQGDTEAGPAYDDNEVGGQNNIIIIFMNENIFLSAKQTYIS